MRRRWNLERLVALEVFLVRSPNGGDWRLALSIPAARRSWVVR